MKVIEYVHINSTTETLIALPHGSELVAVFMFAPGPNVSLAYSRPNHNERGVTFNVYATRAYSLGIPDDARFLGVLELKDQPMFFFWNHA